MNNQIGLIMTSKSWGGLEMNVFKLARLLEERNWEVHFFVLKESRIALEAANTIKHIHYIGQHKKYFDISGAIKFCRQLRNEKIDQILVFHNYDLDFIFLTKLFSLYQLKVIYQQHMQIGVKKKDLVHALRYSAIDFWLSPLNMLKEEVIEKTPLNPDKIRVIPLGTDISKFIPRKYTKAEARDKLELSHSVFIMGIIGRIDPLKGQLFLIQSIHQLRQKHPELELLIVGEPSVGEIKSTEYLAELKEYVNHHDLKEVIHFRNFTKDVSLFYNAVDLFALASIGETYGMVTIESMLSGVPVIATNSAGTKEILDYGKLGHLYIPNDLDDFCQQVDLIFSDLVHTNEMASKAQRIAREKYSQDTECSSIEELIRNI